MKISQAAKDAAINLHGLLGYSERLVLVQEAIDKETKNLQKEVAQIDGLKEELLKVKDERDEYLSRVNEYESQEPTTIAALRVCLERANQKLQEYEAKERQAKKTHENAKKDWTYVAYYGGGVGPDVWDSEKEFYATDIFDAARQAQELAEEGAWVWSIDQRDHPEPNSKDRAIELENESYKLKARIQELEEKLSGDTYALQCRIQNLTESKEELEKRFKGLEGSLETMSQVASECARERDLLNSGFNWQRGRLSLLVSHCDQMTNSTKPETTCACCGEQKETPLRRDEMGGYVCLTCIDKRLTDFYTNSTR